ncbi:peptidoglycan-binding protein [Janibacter sp. GXQ6167]|uniref:L,D-transpeptidase family protein n=1 Tax=Janibacter sp. GXQ6167 TaxID=3240791 RepID=UPI003525A76E
MSVRPITLVVGALVLGLAACGISDAAPMTTTTSSSVTSSAATPSTPTPTASTTTSPFAGTKLLKPGDSGRTVTALQQRLNDMGYWNGTPDGTYGELTQQAVMALQKVAGLDRDGIAGAATLKAVQTDHVPPLVGGPAERIEIDLERQILVIVKGGEIYRILNTSTGSNAVYTSQGAQKVAVTPKGTFAVYKEFDGSHVGPLGALWRPKYFNGGIAVHGAPYIPGYAASHGCARLSNAAMDMIWREDLMPHGETVIVH